MVKTLRITTMLIALAALGVIIFIAAKGMAVDKGIETFLSTPGIAEQMQAGSSGVKSTAGDQETPLIRQAKAFALRIDPPPPPAAVARTASTQGRRTAPSPKVNTITAKFKLVGTSYYPGEDGNSWALIDEVGKGWHWVRLGEKVGHLTVERIGDGAVLINDGGKSYELAAERQQKTDYVTSFTGQDVLEKTVHNWQSGSSAVTQVESSGPAEVLDTQTSSEEDSGITAEDLQENLDWLKQLQENPEELGMTDEEAKELEGLGELLQSLETEIKTIESKEPNGPGEPNLADDVNKQNVPSEISEDDMEAERIMDREDGSRRSPPRRRARRRQ
ncbi:MAG: hypothetical protein JW806_05625 [Sedimentisphaerales bacterium]|nr:hypothetical protein [Sedimentisphaerales bacterium]